MPRHRLDIMEEFRQRGKFGRLTPIEEAGTDRWKNRLWRCRCDCGNETVVIAHHLVSCNSESCGCGKGRKKKGDCDYDD